MHRKTSLRGSDWLHGPIEAIANKGPYLAAIELSQFAQCG